MFQTQIVEKIKTHFIFNKFRPPPPPDTRAFHEIMCKNVVEPDRPQMTQYGACALHAY